MRLWGTVQTANEPYLSLSGTSMASPVVSGTIALMLQANPALTPNLVKAILQFTAESRDGYNPLTQGAGFLNTRGAVELAQSMEGNGLAAAVTTAGVPVWTAALEQDPTPWSRHIIWGNHRMGGGQITATANAWRTDVTWGSGQAPDGTPIVLGTPVVNAGDFEARNIVWGTECGADCNNIVWGTACGGADCHNIVWGTSREGDPATTLGAGNIAWGATGDGDAPPATAFGAGNIVWGTNLLDDTDNIVWGASAMRRRSRMLVTEPAHQ